VLYIVFKASLRRRLSDAYASDRARSSRRPSRLRFGSKARGGGEVEVLLSPDGLDACSTADLSGADSGDAFPHQAFAQGRRRRWLQLAGAAAAATAGEVEALPATGQGQWRQGGLVGGQD
jgi:hypothetical protein